MALLTLVGTAGAVAGPAPRPEKQVLPPNPAVIRDGRSPCQPFRLACSAAGFSLTSPVKGTRLIAACMAPMVKGEEVKNPTTGAVVPVPVGADAQACAANIHFGPGKPTTGMIPTANAAAKTMRTNKIMAKIASQKRGGPSGKILPRKRPGLRPVQEN